MESLQRFVTARRPLSVIASMPVRGWRACYGTGTNDREVSRESTRDQSGRRRCAVRHHVRAGIDHAHEQSRGRSERPRAWPKRALSLPASVPIAQLLLRPLLRLWWVRLWRLWRLWRVRLWRVTLLTQLRTVWILGLGLAWSVRGEEG